MKRSLFALCFVALTVAGCGENSDCQDSMCRAASSPDDLATQSQALKPRTLGDFGGYPYGDGPKFSLPTQTTAGDSINGLGYIGKAFTIGSINGDKLPDIMYSAYTFAGTAPGRIRFQWSVNTSTDNFSDTYFCSRTSEGPTSCKVENREKLELGINLVSGDLCPDISTRGVVIASAFSMQSFNGSFVIDARKGTKGGVPNTQHKITDDTRDFVGEHIAVADITGDGKNDLIYSAQGLGSDSKNSVYVLPDVCNVKNTKGALLVGSKTTAFGSAVYVVDLNGKGEKEIVVVDSTFGEKVGGEEFNVGAIYFYKYTGKGFVESRKPVTGEIVEREGGGKSGGQISSVAFADIDGDGLLDLIVGEPSANAGKGNKAGRVRTYKNNGTGFDAGRPKWMFDAPNGWMNFGSDVKVADINGDGVLDLIVGAPGKKKDATPGQQGHVFVFVGTKDGSVFSKEPFWKYKASSSEELFGWKVEAADIDGKGWLDLVVGAPGQGAGRIHVFANSEGHCYRADKCFVDGVCYDNGETAPNDKCQVCDPSRNNFGFSEVVCSKVPETACKTAIATCSANVGCQAENKPDGTKCAETACSGTREVSSYVCASGACQPQKKACGAGLYCKTDATAGASCQAECAVDGDCKDKTKPKCKLDKTLNVLSCQAECAVDADCADGLLCKTDPKTKVASCQPECVSNGDCTDPLKPVCKINASTKVASCQPECVSNADCTDPLKPVCKTDPDTKVASCQPECASDADCADGLYCKTDPKTKIASCQPECVKDSDCGSGLCINGRCSAIIDYNPVITKPAQGEVVKAESVVFEGTARANQEVTVQAMLAGDSAQVSTCNATADDKGAWKCEIMLNTNDYKAIAVSVVDGMNYPSVPVTFSVELPVELTLDAPTEGAELKNHVVFSGKAPAGAEVSVRHVADSTMICSGKADLDKMWSCTTTALETGDYKVYAHVSNELNTMAAPRGFSVVRTVPVITEPVAGSETSVRPTIKGTIAGAEGLVTVWQIGDAVQTQLCIAPISTEGVFQCTTGFDLEYETAYKIRATWIDESVKPNIELSSEDVEFKTSKRPREPISILMPADGTALSTTNVIFSGIAEAFENVVVYYGMASEGGIEELTDMCTARANGNGRWACTDRELAKGEYKAYAINAEAESTDTTSRSATIKFAIVDDSRIDIEDGKYETSGGSCSALPNSTHHSAPLWFFAFAGIAGLGALRRRRSE